MSRSMVIIPEKHYVGMVNRSDSSVPLGFITPWGEDKAAQKRMETVDSWVKGNRSKTIPTTIIDNIPMAGFKLTSGIRTGQYGAVDKWRIEDPRGFELEISSNNLAMVMAVSTIEKGEILEKCVWARTGGNNILLSVESDDYKEAVSQTTIASTSASWKDAKIGNVVTLQNGLTGVYYGKMYALCKTYKPLTADPMSIIEMAPKPYFVILSDGAEYAQTYKKTIHLIASPKLSSINSQHVIEKEVAEIDINSLIHKKDCYVDASGYRSVCGLTYSTVDAMQVSMIDENNIIDPFEYRSDDEFGVFAKTASGNLVQIHNRQYRHSSDNSCEVFDPTLFPTGIVAKKVIKDNSYNRYYSRSDSHYISVVEKNITVADIKSIHRVIVSVVSKNTGNTISIVV